MNKLIKQLPKIKLGNNFKKQTNKKINLQPKKTKLKINIEPKKQL